MEKQMNKLLCQINDEGFITKPEDIRFYGKLRDKMIQKPWTNIDEALFVHKVTRRGYAFYGCLFDGHDLMETGQQRLCWKAQTLVGVDIDKTKINPLVVWHQYRAQGLEPWLIYPTFSDGKDGLRSYRLLWKVEVDLNIGYEQWADVIKKLSTFTSLGDPRARDCSRLWQGGLAGPIHYGENHVKIPYTEFTSKL